MITIEELANRKGLASSILVECGVVQRADGLEFRYLDAALTPARSRIRTALRGADGSIWSRLDHRPIREYGNTLALLPTAPDAWIVEGESDCWVLYSHGQLAVGVPGADNIGCLNGRRVNNFRRLFLVMENIQSSTSQTFPEGTSGFVQEVARQLKDTGYSGEMFVCRPPAGCQDISDIHTSGDDFLQAIRTMKSDGSPI